MRALHAIVIVSGYAAGARALSDVVGFVAHPATNSAEFAAHVEGLGLAVERGCNFDSHPAGPLVPHHYWKLGVNVQADSDWTSVQKGSGSGTGSSGEGEGAMPDPETYLHIGTGGRAGFVDLRFDPPRSGVGIMTADLYLATPLSIIVYDSADAEIGRFERVTGIDFQLDELYFVGAADAEGRIARVRLEFASVAGDSIYIPEFWLSAREGSFCAPDCKRDGRLDVNDFICFQNEWRRQTGYGDYDGSGVWNVNDFIAYQAEWRKGCE